MINTISNYGSYMSYQQSQGMQEPRGPAEMFSRIDSDGSGGISQTELETLVEKISGKTGETIDTEDAVSTYDTDGDGELSNEELRAFLDASGLQPPPRQGMGMMGMQQGPQPDGMFKDADSDESGGISQTELETLTEQISLRTGKTMDTEDAVSIYDTDGDGELSNEELHSFLEASGLQPPRGPMQDMDMSGVTGSSYIGNAMNTYLINGAADISEMMDLLDVRGGLQGFMNNPVDFLV